MKYKKRKIHQNAINEKNIMGAKLFCAAKAFRPFTTTLDVE